MSKDEMEKLFVECTDTDYSFNGEDEVGYDYFDKSSAADKVLEIIKQESIAFMKYCETETVRVGEDSWTHRSDNFTKHITSEELFTIYSSHKVK